MLELTGKATRSAERRTRPVSEARRARLAPAAPTAEPATDDLIATIAHEIRTPIHALSATAEFLAEDFDALSRDEAADMLVRMRRSAAYLQNLVENLAAVAQPRDRRASFQPEPVSLEECCQDAAAVVQPLLARKGQSVRVVAPAEPVMVWADPTAIGQVLVNLLNNASKYSVREDRIDLIVSVGDGVAEVRVVDHGPGISAEDQARIFQRYVRGTNPTAGGLGIGLSVVRTLVEMHGGTVSVESQLGQGATFVVALPLEPTSLALAS